MKCIEHGTYFLKHKFNGFQRLLNRIENLNVKMVIVSCYKLLKEKKNIRERPHTGGGWGSAKGETVT